MYFCCSHFKLFLCKPNIFRQSVEILFVIFTIPISLVDVSPTILFAEFCNVFPSTLEIIPSASFPDPLFGNLGTTLSTNENNSENKLTISPNPYNEENQITLALQSKEDYTIQIIDMYGKTLLKRNFNDNTFAFNSSSFASGIYLVNVVSTNKKYNSSQKFVVNQ